MHGPPRGPVSSLLAEGAYAEGRRLTKGELLRRQDEAGWQGLASSPLEATLPGFSVRNLLEFPRPRSLTAVPWSVPVFLPAKASAGAPLLRQSPLVIATPLL